MTATSAVVTFATDEPTTAWVNYGPTVSYGYTATASALASSHAVALVNLNPATVYHYRVAAMDVISNGPTLGSDYTLTTASDTAMYVVDSFHVPLLVSAIRAGLGKRQPLGC